MSIWGTGPAPHSSWAAVTCPQTTGLAGALGSWAWDRRQRGQWGGHLAPAPRVTRHTPPRASGAAGSGAADHPLRGVLPLAAPPMQGAIQSVLVPGMTFLAKWHLIVCVGRLVVGGRVES